MITKEQVVQFLTYVLNGEVDNQTFEDWYTFCKMEYTTGNTTILTIPDNGERRQFVVHVRDVAK